MLRGRVLQRAASERLAGRAREATNTDQQRRDGCAPPLSGTVVYCHGGRK